MKSSAFWRALPVPARTADESSFSAQVSPAPASNPAAAIRCLASTPASYHEPLPATTQALQPFQLISSRAWKPAPSARICAA